VCDTEVTPILQMMNYEKFLPYIWVIIAYLGINIQPLQSRNTAHNKYRWPKRLIFPSNLGSKMLLVNRLWKVFSSRAAVVSSYSSKYCWLEKQPRSRNVSHRLVRQIWQHARITWVISDGFRGMYRTIMTH